MNRYKHLDLEILQTQSPQLTDPLINKGEEHTLYIGVFLVLILIVLVIGAFSQKLRAAIAFSILLSLVLIILLAVA